jgi:hypothetical protein
MHQYIQPYTHMAQVATKWLRQEWLPKVIITQGQYLDPPSACCVYVQSLHIRLICRLVSSVEDVSDRYTDILTTTWPAATLRKLTRMFRVTIFWEDHMYLLHIDEHAHLVLF